MINDLKISLKLNINNFKIFTILFLMLVPIAIPLGKIGRKPIDLVYSDILLVLVLLLLPISKPIMINRKEKKLLIYSLLCFVYILTMGLIGSIIQDGDLLPLLSSLRFSKHLLFVLVALYIYKKFKPSLFIYIKYLGVISAIITLILFLSDLTLNPLFPASRWGSLFLGQETYGFPNLTAVFYCFYLTLIILYSFMYRKFIYLPILLLCLSIIFFTFSRSAWITAIIITIPLLTVGSLKSRNLSIINLSFLLLAVLTITHFFDLLFPVIEPWLYKVDSITGKNITLSGRELIWIETQNLIFKKPILGYFFHSFSNYVPGYDTPHQQYLEILFKVGSIGFLIYFSFIVYILRAVFIGYIKMSKLVSFSIALLSAGILISNFAQPNFSFSIIGNSYIFILSLFYFIYLDKEKTSETNTTRHGKWSNYN